MLNTDLGSRRNLSEKIRNPAHGTILNMKHKSALTASSLMLVLVGCQSEEISKNNVADMVNIAEEKYKNKANALAV